ncbi:multifunctional CCA addition/repair protein [Pseudomonas sp. F1_0610]|uniref:multifunctional CCA addition/repair protein n=1 Tax=Pseudomonas sp. F1_0610 TaxID=3114284 RepID=UPI0039C46C86
MQIFKVGGAVRDRLLNQPITDIDYVVVGASPQQMLDAGFQPVGADFPVFLHPETKQEYALARTERKSGHGYGGFEIYSAPDVSLEDDLIRRDLTINAIAEDEQGIIYDPHNGQADIAQRVLRHVSPAFAEDPLRVLRVARFAARYANLGFSIAPETLELMQQLAQSGELNHLTPERVWKEVSRALMEPRPDVFISSLRECQALSVLFPEVDALFGVPQNPKSHPEIDTGLHLLHVLRQCAIHKQSLAVRWACLLHDLGKGLTDKDQLPHHPNHDKAGIPLIKAVNQRYRIPKEQAAMAVLVGQYHSLCHRALELSAEQIAQLLYALNAIQHPQRLIEFCAACEMDSCGRYGFEQQPYPQSDFLRGALDAAKAISSQPFIEQGLKGPAFGEALLTARTEAIKHYMVHYQDINQLIE